MKHPDPLVETVEQWAQLAHRNPDKGAGKLFGGIALVLLFGPPALKEIGSGNIAGAVVTGALTVAGLWLGAKSGFVDNPISFRNRNPDSMSQGRPEDRRRSPESAQGIHL